MLLSSIPISTSGGVTTEERQITSTEEVETSPKICADSEGNFHVIYIESYYNNENLAYRKVDHLGDTLVGPKYIDEYNVYSTYGGIAIDVDDRDRVHIAYSVISYESHDVRSLNYCRLSIDGEYQVAPRRVYSSNLESVEPDVFGDQYGHAHIAWVLKNEPPVIMRMEYGPNGLITDPEEFGGGFGAISIGGEVSSPKIGVTSNGIVMVVWLQKATRLSRTAVYYDHRHPVDDEYYEPAPLDSELVMDASGLEGDMDLDDELEITYIMGNEVRVRSVYVEPDGVGRGYRGSTLFTPESQWGEVMNPGVTNDNVGNRHYIFMTREDRSDAPWELQENIHMAEDDYWTGFILVMQDIDPGYPCSVGGVDGRTAIVRSDGDDLILHLISMTYNTHPIASLSVRPTNPEVGEEVEFDGRDSYDPDEEDQIVEWYVDYGDGEASGWGTDPVVTYASGYREPGNYIARLTVRDNHGSYSESDTVIVQVGYSSQNEKPRARFTAVPVEADIGEDITFSGATSDDPDGSVTMYNFDFGDGHSTGWVAQASHIHSYNHEGVFTTSLVVMDDEGLESEPSHVAVTISHVNKAPTATIVSISPTTATEGEQVAFDGTGADDDGAIEAFEWTSDLDGTIGTTAQFARADLTVGQHTIALRVRDDEGTWSPKVTAVLVIERNREFTLKDVTSKRETNTDHDMRFRVVYTDPEGDLPTRANLLYSKGGEWMAERLDEVDPDDEDTSDGKEYSLVKSFEPGKYRYAFEFENSHDPRVTSEEVQFEVAEDSPFIPGWEAIPILMGLLMAYLVASLKRNSTR